MKDKDVEEDLNYVHESLIGFGVQEADTILNYYNKRLRVVKEDGESYLVTQDLRLDRLNVEVKDGVIIREYWG